MNKKKLIISVGLMSLWSVAHSLENLSYSNNDWAVNCDNTNFCRATGYASEDSKNAGASILLIIEPGQNENIIGFARTIDELEDPLTLYVNNENLGPVDFFKESRSSFVLSPLQISRLLDAKTVQSIEFKEKDKVFNISQNGMEDIFIKVDEFQNKTNTPLGIIAKGQEPMDNVKSLIDLTVIDQGEVVNDEHIVVYVTNNLDRFYPYLTDKLDKSECEAEAVNDVQALKNSINVYALNEEHAVISHRCVMTPSSFGDKYWLVDKDINSVKDIKGTYTYEDGILISSKAGSENADCFSYENLVWNGDDFQLAYQTNTGLCRGAPGGFWNLPTYITDVKSYDTHEHE